MTIHRLSVARRRCLRCRRVFGFGIWPWSGRWVVDTHGLCHGCYQVIFDGLPPQSAHRSTAGPARDSRATSVH